MFEPGFHGARRAPVHPSQLPYEDWSPDSVARRPSSMIATRVAFGGDHLATPHIPGRKCGGFASGLIGLPTGSLELQPD